VTGSEGELPVTGRPGPGGSHLWLLLLRLVLFCLIVGASVYAGVTADGGQWLIGSYGAATLLFLVLYRRGSPRGVRPWVRLPGILLVLLEVAVEGILVSRTHAIASPYLLLFLLTIVSASLQFRLVGTLLVATATSVAITLAAFVAVAQGDTGLQAARDFTQVLRLNDDLFYALFLYVCGFYLAAFVSGYLSEKLELQDRALEGASRALEKARLETDDILRHMQSGLLTLDERGTIVFFNRTAEEILGIAEGAATGRPLHKVMGEGMRELALLLDGSLSGLPGRARCELWVTRADGKRLPLGLSTSLLAGPDRTVRGVIAIFQDLTEAKRLEERMRVADRLAAVGELSASIAHEIRNPLATVTGSVELLGQMLPEDAESRSLMELIIKESGRLNRIVSDFLDFTRIKRQACEEVDLEAVAQEVVRLFEHHPARHVACEVRCDVEPGSPSAAASRDQVQQMLVNLVQNALEAVGHKPGEVLLRVSRVARPQADASGFVEIVVADTGPGIPDAWRDKIGQPFFSGKKKGTGLGLAIVQRLALANRGSLRWQSLPGSGAQFILRLPAYSPNDFNAEVAHLSAAAGRPLG
jgi:two-component system sensor histidine kinase PilS (NtrC family)